MMQQDSISTDVAVVDVTGCADGLLPTKVV